MCFSGNFCVGPKSVFVWGGNCPFEVKKIGFRTSWDAPDAISDLF